ncbi:MAG: amidohydrolase [Oscillospiraceae bacterium]|nr:amidohydrolase [Oscillospiraceae bacterium]
MDKQKLYEIVEQKAPRLTELSDKIWEYAELSMLEYKSAAAYCAVLKEEGFTVAEQLCGIPTAFSGTYGSGKPVIGILGEYDALSGLSQEPGVAERKPITPDGCGQGCGHNLLGAGALGAAIAVKEAIAAGELSGTVVFYGCPGEEGCAGKTFMARDGMFRDLDAAITWHPGDTNEIMVGSNAACIQLEYAFTGTAAHAAGNPWHGRSALDAAELMNIGVQFLREHMEPNCSIHYSFSDTGGISPNVVQPTARVIYMVRAETVRKAKALVQRVENIAKGAALMTDTTVTWHQIDGTANTLSNQVLEKLLHDNLLCAPLPQYTEEEMTFASALKATFGPCDLPGDLTKSNPMVKKFVMEQTANGTAPMNNFIMPYVPSFAFSPGSTDVGDVSWLTPTAQFNAATYPSGSPGHSWQNVSAGKTSLAHKGMLLAAKVLAAAAADLMTQPQILKDARAEFDITAAEGYDCPIGPEVTPNPQ